MMTLMRERLIRVIKLILPASHFDAALNLLIGLLIFAIILMLAACGPSLSAGKVVGKHYKPEEEYWSTQCLAYNEDFQCSVRMPVREVDPEKWLLVIEDTVDGKSVRDQVRVDRATYERCRTGRHYPDCDPV